MSLCEPIDLNLLESPSVLNNFSITTDEEAKACIETILQNSADLKPCDKKILLLCKKIVHSEIGDDSTLFGPEEFASLLSTAINNPFFYKEIIALSEHILYSLEFEGVDEKDIPADVYLDAGLAIGSLSSENWAKSFTE